MCDRFSNWYSNSFEDWKDSRNKLTCQVPVSLCQMRVNVLEKFKETLDSVLGAVNTDI